MSCQSSSLTLAGCVFAASSIGKLSSRRAYRSFRDQLAETRLVPKSMGRAAAASLASTEAAVALALLAADGLTISAAPGAAWLAESALIAAAAVTLTLALGVAAVVRRGTTARCACFGAQLGRPLGPVHLARNLSLLAVVCAGLVAAPLAAGRPSLPTAALAAVAGAIAALLFVRWDDIAELLGPMPTAARQQTPRES
jgi:hypothetical protein